MVRLLIHAPSPSSLERARRNLANLLKLAPDAQVELVVNAGAVAAALDTPHPLDGYLRVCANTLTANGRAVPDAITTVPAAVLYLAERQAEGWSYIRA